MENRKLFAALGYFKSMKGQSINLLNSCATLDKMQIEAVPTLDYQRYMEANGHVMDKIALQTTSMMKDFNENVEDYKKETGINLKTIENHGVQASLSQIIRECDKVIMSIEKNQSLLSSEETDKLDKLRAEASKICENLEDINFEKNLEESIKESERGHFLASSLITSRIIEYTIERLEGKTIEEKIKNLVKKDVIKVDNEDLKQQIMKASKLSRNYLNHRIDSFAESSDAFSLLGGCLTLLKAASRGDLH